MPISHESFLLDIERIVEGMAQPLNQAYSSQLNFKDLGLDSLALVELVAEIELRYGLVIEDSDYKQLQSADEIATYLTQHLRERR